MAGYDRVKRMNSVRNSHGSNTAVQQFDVSVGYLYHLLHVNAFLKSFEKESGKCGLLHMVLCRASGGFQWGG